MPKRIQRRRAKGWKMPENTICVDRGTKWGNPYIVGKHGSREYCVELFANLFLGFIVISAGKETYENAINYPVKKINELKGKNLACWCPLDKPCHADILLKIANA